jgi:hypothetical protein
VRKRHGAVDSVRGADHHRTDAGRLKTSFKEAVEVGRQNYAHMPAPSEIGDRLVRLGGLLLLGVTVARRWLKVAPQKLLSLGRRAAELLEEPAVRGLLAKCRSKPRFGIRFARHAFHGCYFANEIDDDLPASRYRRRARDAGTEQKGIDAAM